MKNFYGAKNFYGTVLAICCLGAAKAAPSQWGSSSSQQQLDGVPDLFTFGKITFPKYDLLDLGEYSKDHLPGDEIKVTKESKITIPQPYPVKIPIPQPYPVHIEKPYPVHETKIIKVPVPVPQIVEKKVPYPVEVPKPYPVHIQDHSENGGGGGGFEIHQALEGGGYGVQEEHAELPSNEGYEGGIGGGNFNPYETKALEGSYEGPSAESGGWQPIEGDEAGH
ncbi:hypothetical protein ABEB36_013658 [Hypothenemus hampei]|uniref:Uncharacterized protein n=1 Tax=Hypothenemus hampei TaxID=57062 RepID=A0ABD1E4W6_HYPHA